MPVDKVTMFFVGRNQGWSEYHMLNTQSTIPRDNQALVTALCQKRAQFLGAPYSILGFRIAAYLNNDTTRANRQSWLVLQNFVSGHPSTTGNAEPADVALLGVGVNNAFEGVSRFFMGAPPDAAVDNGGLVNPGAAGLGTDVGNYFAFLLNPGVQGASFGWGVSGTPADNQIKAITQVADGRVSIQFTAAVALPQVHSTFYPARIRQVNQGKSPLNGQCLVQVTATDTVTTKEIIGFSTDQTGGFCKIYPQLRQFAPYVALVFQNVVGNHRRGRPFGSSRGRAATRVRG